MIFEYLIITLVAIIHFNLINPLEKILVQVSYKTINRPSEECKNNNTLACLGMPSGHMETLLIILILSYFWLGMPAFMVFLLIFAIAFQRIYSKRHTINQVIIGATLGLIYGFLYLSSTNFFYISLISLLILIIILLNIVAKINNEIYKPLPLWVNKTHCGSINKKQNTSLINKILHICSLCFLPEYSLLCTWDVLENHLDTICNYVEQNNIDIVVGMKTGGAIISDYVAQKLNKPLRYIKISKNCNKKPSDYYMYYLNPGPKQYSICEEINDDLKNKRILLLDEAIYTGDTILHTKEYLLGTKKVSHVYVCVICNYGKRTDVFQATSNKYIIWPWGFDN